MPPAGATEANKVDKGAHEKGAYPSRSIAFQAAGMITSIMEALMQYNQLRFTPAFMSVLPKPSGFRMVADMFYSIYSLFSALLMHVYQMRSSNPDVVVVTRKRLILCMHAMKEISKTWNVAKAVHTLFDSILGNKNMEEKLQKAAGKRHSKTKSNGAQTRKETPRSQPAKSPSGNKRKLEEIETGFSGGPNAAKVSFERSQPASPTAATGYDMQNPRQMLTRTSDAPPGMDLGQQMQGSSPMLTSANDAYMPGRGQQRTASPFPFYNSTDTPPDLFLHTRNSPNISQDLWQNYQPDQLFPADGLAFNVNMASPASAGEVGSMSFNGKPLAYGLQADGLGGMPQTMNPAMQGQTMPMGEMPSQQAWDNMQAVGAQPMGQLGAEDALSNSSGGAIAPSTLNVGDW